MSKATKDDVLELLKPWVGVRSAFPLEEGQTADDEVEVRVFDWDAIKDNPSVLETVGMLFDDVDVPSDRIDDYMANGFDDGFCKKDPNVEFDTFSEGWLPIAITGTGGQEFISHDDEGFYLPQFSGFMLVHLDEVDGPNTPVYEVGVSGCFVLDGDRPEATTTLGELVLCEPVNPE